MYRYNSKKVAILPSLPQSLSFLSPCLFWETKLSFFGLPTLQDSIIATEEFKDVKLRERGKTHLRIPIHMHGGKCCLSYKRCQGLINMAGRVGRPLHGREGSTPARCILQGPRMWRGLSQTPAWQRRDQIPACWLAVACLNCQTKHWSCRGKREIKHVCFCFPEAIRDL